MLAESDRIFCNLDGHRDPFLAGALARGAWGSTADFLALGPDTIITEITRSGLRGRGGAGVVTGMKWSFMPKTVGERPHYLVINGDESEPGPS